MVSTSNNTSSRGFQREIGAMPNTNQADGDLTATINSLEYRQPAEGMRNVNLKHMNWCSVRLRDEYPWIRWTNFQALVHIQACSYHT